MRYINDLLMCLTKLSLMLQIKNTAKCCAFYLWTESLIEQNYSPSSSLFKPVQQSTLLALFSIFSCEYWLSIVLHF